MKLVDSGLGDCVEVDSAGTHDYHVGNPPDPRAQQAAAARHIDITELRGRQVQSQDFYDFDLVLAMDRTNMRMLEAIRPADGRADLRMMLDFIPATHRLSMIDEVPDPYGGGRSGFERVLDLLEVACDGLVAWIKDQRS